MFTRMSKGLLIFLEVVLVIAAIVGGCAIGAEANSAGLGFVLILLFLVVGFLIMFSLGLFIELANNVLDIKQMLAKQNGGYAGIAPTQYSSAQNSNAQNGRLNLAEAAARVDAERSSAQNGSTQNGRLNLAELAAQADVERSQQQSWFCSECGTRNSIGVAICKACGKDKYGN